MKRFNFVFLLFTVIIFFYLPVEAAKKKNAQYTGKELIEKDTMFNAGTWYEILNKCEGTFAKEYKSRLGALSWEDYRNFNKGHSYYAGNDWVVTKCDNKENAEVMAWYNEIIAYIESELNIGFQEQTTETTQDNQTQDNDSVSEKLKKLKSMFDEELITQEEYDAKRKEILDEM